MVGLLLVLLAPHVLVLEGHVVVFLPEEGEIVGQGQAPLRVVLLAGRRLTVELAGVGWVRRASQAVPTLPACLASVLRDDSSQRVLWERTLKPVEGFEPLVGRKGGVNAPGGAKDLQLDAFWARIWGVAARFWKCLAPMFFKLFKLLDFIFSTTLALC